MNVASCENTLPVLIQGGMGAGVSDWRLARAVSMRGHLGVVSGTALDAVLARRLQLGDPTGDLRRALAHFPHRPTAERVLKTYFIEGGKPERDAFRGVPMYTATPTSARQALAVAAGFVEIFLAKEGHAGPVGINFLEKIQLPTPATLYGALLAGVDYVLVGAGIPRDLPGLIERLSRHERASLPLHVTDAEAGAFEIVFDPNEVVPHAQAALVRPRFLAIVSSATLAMGLTRRPGHGVDGFVVEGYTAGGHNAPPRGPLSLSESGEPVYGPRDMADLEKIRHIGLPFWVAGSCASPERLRQARADGAAGVQVGSAFAFCNESGLAPAFRQQAVEEIRHGRAQVHTDPLASPTGFPFKVLKLAGTLSDGPVYRRRKRRCDLGYLREMYLRPDGAIGYRCPAEALEDFERKGGRADDSLDRKCICNGLMANIGLGQRRDGEPEPAILTAGDSVRDVVVLLKDRDDYSAADVIDYLFSDPA